LSGDWVIKQDIVFMNDISALIKKIPFYHNRTQQQRAVCNLKGASQESDGAVTLFLAFQPPEL
jgi:hypothetical protein